MNRDLFRLCALNFQVITCLSALCFGQEKQAPIPSPIASPRETLVGSAHPTIVEGVDPGGRWVALCQARRDSNKDGKIDVRAGQHGNTYGDDLHPYLIWGAGQGQPIGAFLGSSVTGDHLAILRDGQLFLINAETKHEENLSARGADVKAIARLGIPSSIDFGAAGKRFIWIHAGNDGHPLVVVRDLANGREERIDPGKGLLMSASLDKSEEWLVLAVVDQDKDGNGKLERSGRSSSLAPAGCRGPVMSYSTGRARGDLPNWYALSLSGESGEGHPRPISKIAALGTQRLLRDESGAISIEAPDGSSFEVIQASHSARVAGGSFVLGRALLVASAGEDVGKAWIVDSQGAHPLEERLAVPRRDQPILANRLVPSHFEPKEKGYQGVMGVVDMQSGKATLIGGKLTHWWMGQVLTFRDNSWVQVDIDTSSEQVLAMDLSKFPQFSWPDPGYIECESNGPLAAVGGWLIDLQRQRTTRYEGEVIIVDKSGRVLVNDKANDGESDLKIGPLRWIQAFDD